MSDANLLTLREELKTETPTHTGTHTEMQSVETEHDIPSVAIID